MATPHNVELEAAKFLHKLIQDSKDEPTKLATKLYVILQHMRSSGKENSMPYQVISRAMETVISQHGLDIEALMSSRLPLTGGTHIGDSASSQFAGSSQRTGVANDSKASMAENEMPKADAYASSRPPSAGHEIYQGSVSHLSSASGKVHGAIPGASGSYQQVESGIPSHIQFSSSSYDNHGLATKMRNDRNMEAISATPSVELSAGKGTIGKALEHEGGISNTLGNANRIVQSSTPNSVTEMSMLRSTASRDMGKSPISQASAVAGMPFKEQHLKQLRAQCLVFLAFRNGLMPKKLHLDIALGNFFPKEDGPRKELADHKGKEQSINDPSTISEVTMPFGRLENAREAERNPLGPSSTGIIAEVNLLKGAEDPNMMEDKNGPTSGWSEHMEERRHLLLTRRKQEAEMLTPEIAESEAFATKGPQLDPLSRRGSAVSNHDDDLDSHRQVGMSNQALSVVGTSKQMKPEVISSAGNGCHSEALKALLPTSAVPNESVPERKDNALSQSESVGGRNVQGSRHADTHLPGFPVREHWKAISRMDGEHHLVMPAKEANVLSKNLRQVPGTDHEEEDDSVSTDMPSPKYTTSEKWIMDQQKRKLLTEQNWAVKQQKTEQRIAACSDKLKETVSSSEDISAKTKSVIELKKLQLLELQRRLRSDILNDFFKPIAADMYRVKSTKKTRIGRRSKQLEKYEQKMKEERQKRIRERQKEFFSEIEVHKERLEDVFKIKRERWKGFNKYVREFHKRRERIHREKIDRIQREKINLLKINDVEGYLRMVQDAKSDRVKQLLKETEKYLSKLGSKLQEAKSMGRCFETDMDDNRTAGVVEKNEIYVENEDETDQAKHYLESNEKYYLMAHSIKESVAEQPTCLEGGKLREYQMNGLRWLVSLYNNHLNGILADEMGLGKTVQVIALICYLMETKNDRGPFLVVVPSSVLSGWESEINVWAPSINKIVYSGPPEERRRLFKERIVQQKFNVLLTTYEYLMNKHDRPKLSKLHWHYIIIDEGHRIKNASCKLNADLKHYRSSHRLLLTGTPLQNNLEELWALLNFLLPNIFNSSEDFSQWFNKPFESSGDNSPDEALLSEEENLLIINRLHQVLRPFVLRRLKHKVENELPEKIERLIRCEASAYQKLLMKRVEDNLGAIGTSKARPVHNSVMELRNICNHPYLSQLHVEEIHDLIPQHYLPNVVRLCGKLEMLDRLLPKLKATDHRVLLFSTMTRLLDVMEDYLYWKQYRYLRLDGHTSGGERGALIDQFNKPGSPFFIFLLSIRAGGVGVNLQAADTVIIFDTDWNPQVDLQAQARAHRIGQKRDVLVIRLETVQTVEEQVRAAAEHKLGVANQSITAGFFDNNTSAEDRREYLESLLRECKKEEASPVLDDDALNDRIARSESEIDIFESVDKQRQEGEMAAWKKLVSGQGRDGSDHIPPLPSRLLTDDDLKPFYEAMKISEESNPGVLSNVGVKRKSGYLGGLDTQHYGRGKRAREVRSYEEQWTEEEFEKLCQVDSPDSPKLKEEVMGENLPLAASGSVISETSTPVPTNQSVQPSVQVPTQQSKEVTPPSRRGRGRPKRATTEISSYPVVLPAPPGAGKTDAESQRGTGSTDPTVQVPDSLPVSTTVASVSATVHEFGVWIAPSSQSTSPLPSISAGSLSTTTSTPVQGRGRGRKAQSGIEVPRRRGKKQTAVPPAIQFLPASGKPDVGSQGGIASIVSGSSGPDCVSRSTTVKDVSNEPGSTSAVVPILPASSGTGNVDMGSQKGPISCSSVVSGDDSLPGSSILTGISGTVHDLGIGTAPSSLPTPTLPSVAFGPQSIPPSDSIPRQGKGRGRKAQSGVEVKDVSNEPGSTSAVVPILPASSGTGNNVDMGSQKGPISCSSVVSGDDSLPGSSILTGISGTVHDLGIGTAPGSLPTPTLPSVAFGPQSIPPFDSIPKQGKGRGRKAQSGVEVKDVSNEPRSTSAVVPILPASSGTGNNVDMGSQKGPISCSSVVSGDDSLPGSSILTGISGTVHDLGIGTAPGSLPTPTLPSVAFGPQSIAPSDSIPKQGKGRGRKAQSGVEVKDVSNEPRSTSAVVPILPASSGTGNVDMGSQKGPISCSSVVSGDDSLPGSSILTGISGTVHDLGIGTALGSLPTPTLPSVAFGPQSIPPSDSIPKQGKGRGRKAQSGVEAPRRRGKRQDVVTPAAPERLAGQDPISNEPPQKKSRVSVGRKAIATRSKRENEAQKLTDVVQAEQCKVHIPDGSAGHDSKSTQQSDSSPQKNEAQTSAHVILSESCEIHVPHGSTGQDSKSTGQLYSSSENKECKAQKLSNVVQAQPCKVVIPDGSAVQDSKSTVQSDSSSKSKEDEAQKSSGVLQAQPCKVHIIDGSAGQDSKSTLQSDFPEKNKEDDAQKLSDIVQTQPFKVHTIDGSAGQDSKSSVPSDSSLRNKEEEPQKVSDVVQPQPFKVDALDGSAGQDSKSTEQSESSAQNRQETSFSQIIDVGARSTDTNSAYLNENKFDARMKSKDESLSTEVEVPQSYADLDAILDAGQKHTADVRDVASLIEQVPCVASSSEMLTDQAIRSEKVEVEKNNVMDGSDASKMMIYVPESKSSVAVSSEVKIDEPIRNEGGDAPTLPFSSSVDSDAGQMRSVDTRDVASVIKQVPCVASSSEMQIDEAIRSEKESGEEVEVEKNHVLDGLDASKPCEPESKSAAAVSSETEIDKPIMSDGADAPTLPVSSDNIIEVIDNQSLDSKTQLTLSTLGTLIPADVPIEKCDIQSGRECSEKVEAEKDHVLDESVTSKPMVCEPESKSTASVSSDMKIDELVRSEGGDAPTLPVSSENLIELSDNQSLESNAPLAFSTLGTADTAHDLPIEQCEIQSGKDAEKIEVENNHILDESVASESMVSEPDGKITAAVSSEIKIDEPMSEGGDAPTLPVSSESFIEVTDNRSLDSKSHSALSPLETVAPVHDLSIEKCEIQSGKEGSQKVEEDKDHVLDDLVATKPTVKCEIQSVEEGGEKVEEEKNLLVNALDASTPMVCEPESKSTAAVSVMDIASSKKLIDENSIAKGNMEVLSDVPLEVRESETCLSETKTGESYGNENGDAPSLPEPSTTNLEVNKNRSSEEDTYSSMPSLENVAPAFDIPVDGCENPDKSIKNVIDPISEKALVSSPRVCEPESNLPAISVEKMADKKQLHGETSVMGTDMDVFSAGTKTGEPCGSEGRDSPSLPGSSNTDMDVFSADTKIGESCGSEGRDFPSLPESSNPDLEVNKNQSLEDNTCLAVPTLEKAAAAFETPVDQCENQSGKEGDEKVEAVHPVLEEALVLSPSVCEPESKLPDVSSVEKIADAQQLNEEVVVMGSDTDIIFAAPLKDPSSETCSSETKSNKAAGVDGDRSMDGSVSSET